MKNKKNIGSYLFQPFRYVAGWQSLVAGVTVLLLLALLGFLTNTFFDGVIDVHYGCTDKGRAPFAVHLVYLFGSWIILSLVMYLTAIILSKKVRFIDMAGTLAAAKAPYLFMIIPGLFPAMHLCLDIFSLGNPEVLMQALAVPLVVSMLMLPFIVWHVVLLYNAFSVSGNLKGVKGGVAFTVALLISEAASVILLRQIIHYIN